MDDERTYICSVLLENEETSTWWSASEAGSHLEAAHNYLDKEGTHNEELQQGNVKYLIVTKKGTFMPYLTAVYKVSAEPQPRYRVELA